MTKIERLREQLDGGNYPLTRADIRELLDLVEMQHEAMLDVLCDPEGVPCFHGSDGDRAVIRKPLAAFEEWNKP